MFKRAVALFVIAAMALAFSGCETDTTEATASIYTKATERYFMLKVKDLFISILERFFAKFPKAFGILLQ